MESGGMDQLFFEHANTLNIVKEGVVVGKRPPLKAQHLTVTEAKQATETDTSHCTS